MSPSSQTFETRVLNLLPKVFKEFTKTNTPYEKTKEFITEERQKRNLDPKQYSELISNLMASNTDNIYRNAGAFAIEIIKIDTLDQLQANLLAKQIEEIDLRITSKIAENKRLLGVKVEEDGTITYLDDGESEIEQKISLLNEQNSNAKIDLVSKTAQNKRLLGVKVEEDGTITYLEAGESEIEVKIKSYKHDIALKKIDQYKNYGATLEENGSITYEDDEEKLLKITHYLRTLNMETEIALKEVQAKSLKEQTEDNRIIKNMSELAEYVNALGNNDLTAGAAFHKNFMAQQKALLLKNGFTFTDGKVWFKINEIDVQIGSWDENPSTTAQA